MGDLGSRIVALLLTIATAVSDQTTIIQEDPFLLVKEGESIRLNCSYKETQSSLQWYKQYPGGPLEFMVLLRISMTEKKDNFEMSLDTAKKTTSLHLKNTRLEDSAVYFCACRGGYSFPVAKLIFGSGTRLVIMPNLEDSEPSVYQLKTNKGPGNLSVCLVTDYSPGPIEVNIGQTDSVSANGSAVVVKEDGNKELASLGVVRWGKVDEQFHCFATYKGNKYNVKEEKDTCSANEGSSTPVFETDERLNLLSLTVLGLRVIFIKSVALNLILTYRAWSR